MRVSIVVFPGSNCDHDMCWVYGRLLGAQVEVIWHKETDLKNPDLVVIPGGFSYGDYLRTGALAKLSPVMESVKDFAARGGSIIGICNGFQILCEAGLLPGVLLRNRSLRFLSKYLNILVEETDTPFSSKYNKGDVLCCPVAHFEGNYFAENDVIESLEKNRQVIFRYCSADGQVDQNSSEINPNGSINSIAGICSLNRKVIGMMPHPERAAEAVIDLMGQGESLQVFG